MKPAESESELRKRLGGAPEQLTPRETFKIMCDFYANERADGAKLDEDGDMLLYQWGVYNFSTPETFRLGLTRQFMAHGEDKPSQLHLTFHYNPSDELRNVGSSNLWCRSPGDLPKFQQYIDSSPAFQAVADTKADRVELVYKRV
jgi:hypothetical protein